jgi:hypothetical protein
MAAQDYLASGADPARLTPESAAKTGHVPAGWLRKSSRPTDYRLYLRTEPDGLVTVGLLGTYAAMQPLVDRYGVYARRVYFPFASRARKSLSPATSAYYYPLMMSFDRRGLARAAALALAEPPRLDRDSKSHSKYSTPAIGTNPSAAMTPR